MLELDLWLGAGLERLRPEHSPAAVVLWQQLLAESDVVLLQWLRGETEPPLALRALVQQLGCASLC